MRTLVVRYLLLPTDTKRRTLPSASRTLSDEGSTTGLPNMALLERLKIFLGILPNEKKQQIV